MEYVDELDPDVITGWNVVDFDLAVLAAPRAQRYGVPFAIGRTDDEFDLPPGRIASPASRARWSRAAWCSTGSP